MSFNGMAAENKVTKAAALPELKQAWDGYQAMLDKMRVGMESTPRYQDNPQNRAKAYHTLMEMQAMAYNFAIAPRMFQPRIYVHTGWQTDIFTLGQNGQDFYYGVAFLDGHQQYRMTGNMGDISLFLLQILNGLFGEKDVKSVGNYDWADFEIDADGNFEVILSAEKVPGNWIKLDPDIGYQFVIIRRAMVDWNGDVGELKLERISDIPKDHYDAEEFDEAAMAARIRRATDLVRYLGEHWNISLYDQYLKNAGSEKNKMSLLPGTITSEVGNPMSNYAMAIYDLKDDEALVIEMEKAPDGAYWSFQLGNVWSRSLDFTNRLSTINNREVTVQKDGSIFIVASKKDPGINNWLDTTGYTEGTVVFRNYRAMTKPVPSSRMVKFADLKSLFPKDIVKVTAEERDRIIDDRRQGMRNMYD